MFPLANAWRRLLTAACVVGASLGVTRLAAAQDLPRVSPARALRVAGLVMGPHAQDLLGISRVKFQGLIAAQLSAVGYRLADDDAAMKPAKAELPPLTLTGEVREEICDDDQPAQCRVAIQWQLEDARGLAVYRTTTRALAQAASLEAQRRGLVEGALRSLMQRRRFELQLTSMERPAETPDAGPLGFKQCRRPALSLPTASRAVAASLVLIEAGSELTTGAIVSGDGLILTNARTLREGAPLNVRFSAEQVLPAKIAVLDRSADVALLRVAAHTDATCVPLVDVPLGAGAPVFGISSEPSEDRALSLAGSVVQAAADGDSLLVDPLIARGEGGPLLDPLGRLAGVVVAARAGSRGPASAITASAALDRLQLRPAAITDPRLIRAAAEDEPARGFVQDHDDPPFALTKRYTYGTSRTAHQLRTASAVTAAAGGALGGYTWLRFRGSRDLSPAQHQRLVVFNDLGWALLGLGVVGVGVSFALPEGHEVVAARSSASRDLFLGVTPRGIELGGHI
jgi:hypothetical protein